MNTTTIEDIMNFYRKGLLSQEELERKEQEIEDIPAYERMLNRDPTPEEIKDDHIASDQDLADN